MKKFELLSTLFFLIFSSDIRGQISPLNNNGISITYTLAHQQNNTFFPAVLNNNADLINGVSYNNGNALSFTVSSPATYSIRISAQESNYVPYAAAMSHMSDVRDFIFYSVTENTTGGFVKIKNSGDGDVLGNAEKTILSNCPATLNPNSPSSSEPKTFSLQFKIKPGYSVPPGNYYTPVIITATYE
jgi:hypothetical protein